jgi:hypothetical protein
MKESYGEGVANHTGPESCDIEQLASTTLTTGHARMRTRPAHAVPASSPLSAVDPRQRIDLEIAFGEDALELGVLALQRS